MEENITPIPSTAPLKASLREENKAKYYVRSPRADHGFAGRPPYSKLPGESQR
jgi:hypothetical protein